MAVIINTDRLKKTAQSNFSKSLTHLYLLYTTLVVRYIIIFTSNDTTCVHNYMKMNLWFPIKRDVVVSISPQAGCYCVFVVIL